jgi:Fur family ferric uptake transcriptional regulator
MVVTRRVTSQRTAIHHTLAQTGDFASAQDLHSLMRSSGSTIGLATVYRALQDMANTGDVDTVRNATGEVLYRQCDLPTHHHHLVCRRCGRTQEVKAPGVERWAKTVADQYGYVDIDHQVELFGVCAECAIAARAAQS